MRRGIQWEKDIEIGAKHSLFTENTAQNHAFLHKNIYDFPIFAERFSQAQLGQTSPFSTRRQPGDGIFRPKPEIREEENNFPSLYPIFANIPAIFLTFGLEFTIFFHFVN